MSGAEAPIRILHVDDDPDLAEVVATFLEREEERFTVRTATSAAAGMVRLAEETVDCVVSDYDMPGKNGIEFLETVRRRFPDLPFILYTGKGSEEVASEAISVGVTDYLQKDTGTDQYVILANRIENAVAQTRAELLIDRTRAYFGTILEYASDFVMILDGSGEIDYVSPAVERVMGYTPEELAGSDAFETVHPEDRARAKETFWKIRETADEERTVEFRARHADGSWRWQEVRARNLLEDEVVQGIIVSVRDVTERRSSRLELDTVVDNLPGYVYRHRYEEGWPLEFVKGSAEEITGYTATELSDMISDAEEIIHPEDRTAVWEGVQDGLESSGYFDLTYRIHTKAGEVRWIRDQGQLVEDPTSGVEMLDGLIVDVTDRKEREQEFQRQERRFRAIFNDPNILVWLIDTEGSVLDVNRTALQYTDQEASAISAEYAWETPWFDNSASIRADVQEWIERAASGEYVEFEADLEREEGHAYAVQGVFRPVRTTDDEVVSLLISARDVTERTEREQELELFRTLLDHSTDSVLVIDPETGRFVDVNETAYERRGYTKAEMLELTVPDVEEELPDLDAWHDLIDGLAAESVVPFEGTHRRKDGTTFPIEVTATYLELDDEYVVAVSRDVSDAQAG